MKSTKASMIYSMLDQGLELHKRNDLDAAESIYEKAKSIDQKNPDVWHLLGLVAMGRGDLEKAKNLIVKAIKLKPNDAAYFSNLGIVLKDQGDCAAAITSFDHALRLQPEYPEALSNRGLALAQIGKHEEALREYDRAISASPNYAIAHSNRGITLQTLGRHEDAIASFTTAIALNPEFSDAWNNYATILRRLRKYDESLRIYERALKMNPRNAKGFQGRGELYSEIGRIQEAFQDFDRALEINPTYPDPLWAKSFTYLSIGEFDKGWDLYDLRFEQSNRQAGVLNTNKPRWTSERRQDRLLIWSEQGVGDELFFSQWLGKATELGKEITFAADGRLMALHSRAFQNINVIDKAKSIPRGIYDSHLPLGSLPKALRDCGVDWRLARKNPHLVHDEQLTAKLRRDLVGQTGNILCGLTWRSTRPELGAEKSLRLNELAPLLKVPGITFVSLQYGDTVDELNLLRATTGIEIKNHPDVDNLNELDRHVALTAACDELVLTCNATAHVAGTLGKHAFVLAPRGKSLIWYWANRAEKRSFWYSNIEILDQSEQFSWAACIEDIASEIGSKIRDREITDK